MGSELVTKESFPTNNKVGGDKNSTRLSILETIKKAAPYYLSIGMPSHEYWYEDAENVKYYREADKINTERKNSEMWLNGAYIYNAIASLAPILRFSMKPQEPVPYMKKPFDLTGSVENEPEKSQEQIIYEKGFAKMKALAEQVNRKRGVTTDGQQSTC